MWLTPRRTWLALITSGVVGTLGCSHPHREAVESGRRPAGQEEVRISQEARAASELETEPIRRQKVQETMTAAGWLITLPGSDVVIKAAGTGFVIPANGTALAELGTEVSEQQPLASLRILLSPQEEAQMVARKEEADILMRQSLASLQAAETRYQQVKELKGGLVAGKDVLALEESLARSRAAYEEAREQLPFLPPEPYERPLRLQPVTIESPLRGRVTQAHVRPRQFVVQGDPLWTISDWSSLWVRVPVFEGDLPRIDQTRPIEITVPGLTTPVRAEPTGIPQAIEAGRRTVDLLYRLDNGAGTWRPGQSVSASLPSGQTAEKLVVPRSAIVWDAMGNAWVYVERSQNAFERRRIQVGPTLGSSVAAEQGLAEGDRIVTVGAEVLYGEEFKSATPLEEDDE
jgi:RND family efflux transporter MFP subunit